MYDTCALTSDISHMHHIHSDKQIQYNTSVEKLMSITLMQVPIVGVVEITYMNITYVWVSIVGPGVVEITYMNSTLMWGPIVEVALKCDALVTKSLQVWAK